MMDIELLNKYSACLDYVSEKFAEQEPIDAPYVELFRKTIGNIIGCLTLLDRVPHFKEWDSFPESFIIFRSALESVVYLCFLAHFPERCQDYRDHSFIEQAKDIAKTSQFGFYDGLSHVNLINEMEKIFTKRNISIPKDKYLEFESIKRESYFPSYRECLKQIESQFPDTFDKGVMFTLYNFGSQLIHSNKISLAQFYFNDGKQAPSDKDRLLKDLLYLLLSACDSLDLMLAVKLEFSKSEQFKCLYEELFQIT